MLPIFLLALGFASQPPPRGAQDTDAQDDPPEQEITLELRVNRAIALGVDHLRRRQRADGSFQGPNEGQHPGGYTAFAAFTLAKSGIRRNDPALTRALQSLAYTEFKSTYSAAVHVLLCEALHDPARASDAQRSLAFLLENRQQGVWAYPWGPLGDNSNTQFALLALRAARRMGLEVPERVLVDALDGLEVFRHAGGGFTYAPGDRKPYVGITAAALASLAMLQEAAVDLPHLRAELQRSKKLVEEAEAWVEARFDPARNVNGDGSWTPTRQYAHLWAVERWCGLTGRERVAGRDWYAEGATWLLGQQGRDGSFGNGIDIADTCFALLFLRRATVTEGEELAELYAEADRQAGARPVRPWRFGEDALRLTEWWLAGPWSESNREVLLLEPPFDPAEARPRERGKLAREDWERVSLQPDRWTDLEKLAERPGNRQLWVLSTWLAVPDASAPVGEAPQGEPGAASEVLLWLEVDDGWDVWLDGKRISRERRRLGAVASTSLPLRLAPGEHLLTVLVEDVLGVSGFGALLTDPAGRAPPAGLTVRAEQESVRPR